MSDYSWRKYLKAHPEIPREFWVKEEDSGRVFATLYEDRTENIWELVSDDGDVIQRGNGRYDNRNKPRREHHDWEDEN